MKIVCSVFDKKASVFCTPFFSQNQSTAVRDFSFGVQDPNSQISSFAGDYDLFVLGSWDEEAGSLCPHDKPEFICNGGQFSKESF